MIKVQDEAPTDFTLRPNIGCKHGCLVTSRPVSWRTDQVSRLSLSKESRRQWCLRSHVRALGARRVSRSQRAATAHRQCVAVRDENRNHHENHIACRHPECVRRRIYRLRRLRGHSDWFLDRVTSLHGRFRLQAFIHSCHSITMPCQLLRRRIVRHSWPSSLV